MVLRIDYYLSLNSPWTHLGAARVEALAARHGAELCPFPVDFRDVVFPASGGLPLPKRSPQRQRYRMQELRRWRDRLGAPIVLGPRFSPYDEAAAARAVIAARETVDNAAAVRLAHRVLRALWEEERDPADPRTLAELIRECGLDPTALSELAADSRWNEQRERDSRAALARGVFGAPSYVVGDAVFWGQDRLDFLDEHLARGGDGPPGR